MIQLYSFGQTFIRLKCFNSSADNHCSLYLDQVLQGLIWIKTDTGGIPEKEILEMFILKKKSESKKLGKNFPAYKDDNPHSWGHTSILAKAKARILKLSI